MPEQVLTSVYRTGVIPGVTFRNCYTLLYCFDNTVEIQGLSGKYCRADRIELEAFFIMKNIKACKFMRLKNGVFIPHIIQVGE